MTLTPFHIAVQVCDIAEAREFYGVKLGFPEGRSDENWVDYNMFGHQFVVHLNPDLGKDGRVQQIHNPVDEHAVPVPPLRRDHALRSVAGLRRTDARSNR